MRTISRPLLTAQLRLSQAFQCAYTQFGRVFYAFAIVKNAILLYTQLLLRIKQHEFLMFVCKDAHKRKKCCLFTNFFYFMSFFYKCCLLIKSWITFLGLP